MESPTAPAAPAQPTETPTTIAPDHAAANAGNVQGFLDARAAQRDGKPLPPVEVPDTATAEAPKLSRKEREQQEANERVRTAVERATTDLRAQIDELKRSTAAPRRETPAEPAPAPAVADWK